MSAATAERRDSAQPAPVTRGGYVLRALSITDFAAVAGRSAIVFLSEGGGLRPMAVCAGDGDLPHLTGHCTRTAAFCERLRKLGLLRALDADDPDAADISVIDDARLSAMSDASRRDALPRADMAGVCLHLASLRNLRTGG